MNTEILKQSFPELFEQVIKKIISENPDLLFSNKSDIPGKTLLEFKTEYTEAIKLTHSESYLRSIETAFDKLIEYAGNITLIKIDPRLIEKFINHLFSKSKYAAALYYRSLKAAFSKAVIWNYVSSNPFFKVKFPKFQKSKSVYITEDQLKEIIKNSPSTISDIYLFAFYTGLRLGEILNLKWKNVNLKEGLIQVGDSEFDTKAKKIRFVPVCLVVSNVLRGRIPKVINPKKSFVFCKSNGFPFTRDYVSKYFKRAVRKALLDDKIHFHSLRHSFASSLINKGVDVYKLKDLLGHSSVSVTEVYSHNNMDSLKEAVNKFNNAAEG